MVTLKIDETTVSVPAGMTIMEAAETIGIRIPRLCYHPKLSLEGACRVCVVEVKGMRNWAASCAVKVQEGMEVTTGSPEIRQARRDIVELLLDNHPKDCQICERDGNCELQNLAYQLGVRERLFEGERKRFPVEDSSYSIVRNAEKCVLCQRCIRVCSEIQGVHNLSQHWRGVETVVTPAYEADLADSVCINCGQCINVCPTAALSEKTWTEEVWDALNEPGKHVVVHIAPSIRAAIGEGFGMEPGTPATGKTVTALRKLGFDQVFDTNFSADLTIMEEGTEFLHRLENGGPISADHLLFSGLGQVHGAFLSGDDSQHVHLQVADGHAFDGYQNLLRGKGRRSDPDDIYVVSIMPCTAKKFESRRPEFLYGKQARPETDAVLTTRELIWMIKAYGIDFTHLEDGEFDNPLGHSSGAADIFGTTGGVLEAALRTAVELKTGKPIQNMWISKRCAV